VSRRYNVVQIQPLSYVEATKRGLAYIDAEDYFSRFLDYFLADGAFLGLARFREPTKLLDLSQGSRDGRCRVTTSRQQALQLKDELRGKWMKGLDVLYAVNKPLSSVSEFCLTAEYRVTNRTWLGSGQPGDALAQFSDPKAFESCLSLLDVQLDQCVVVFAHDADPVYVLEPSE
jgi:hypothetical protein